MRLMGRWMSELLAAVITWGAMLDPHPRVEALEDYGDETVIGIVGCVVREKQRRTRGGQAWLHMAAVVLKRRRSLDAACVCVLRGVCARGAIIG